MLIVGAIGGAGWYFNNDQRKQNTADSALNANEGNNTSTSTEDSTKQCLEIPELAIKLPLTSDNADAYCVMKKDDAGNNYASISTRTLAKFDKGCSAESYYFGSVRFFSDPKAPDPFTGDHTMIEVFPDALESKGRHYYISTNHQSACYGASKENENTEFVGKALFAFDKAKLEKL